MAIIRCPQCGGGIRHDASRCGVCDASFGAPLNSTSDPSGQSASTTSGNFLGYSAGTWLAAPFIGLAFYAFLTFMGGEDAPPLTDAERRTVQIERQFSPISGAHRGVEDVIKAAMNDPDSYQHVSTVYVDGGDTLTVQTVYRGRNGFGGVVPGTVTARVSLDGQVLEILEQN